MLMQDQLTEFESDFSEALIHEQVQKIFRFRPFAVSAVLRNFLMYVVDETLSGRSNYIKEYSIAVDVLGKPAGFNTVHSGIVRVHARRLRRALDSYYSEMGKMDACFISIPTGRYVPVFKSRELSTVELYPEKNSWRLRDSREKIKMAVMPFHCVKQNAQKTAFVDSIGLMLNEALGYAPGLSLISYSTTQLIKNKLEGIPSLLAAYDLDYVLTGNVYFGDNNIRVNFQLVHARTEIQLFSETSSWQFGTNNYFELSDMIVSRMLTILGKFSGWDGQQSMKGSIAEPFKALEKKEKLPSISNKRVRTAIA
jgi:TolB-like protein